MCRPGRKHLNGCLDDDIEQFPLGAAISPAVELATAVLCSFDPNRESDEVVHGNVGFGVVGG